MKKYLMGGLIGAITGDALGVPYEFSSRKHMEECNVDGMTGYGTYHQPMGTWSDDSSMTLATMDSLQYGVDYDDLMTKYCDWINHASYTPHGETFDYGRTTFYALRNYWHNHKDPLHCGLTDIRSNGNGSLMRILPVTYYCYLKGLGVEEQVELINNMSSLTHAHRISQASCNIYNFVIQRILCCKQRGTGESLQECISGGLDDSRSYYDNGNYPEFRELYSNNFQRLLNSVGSKGYVVDSLQTALVISACTDNYVDSILQTVRLGGDTDTNAMITGGITGLYYGYEDIPSEWVDVLVRKGYIAKLCDTFLYSLLNK